VPDVAALLRALRETMVDENPPVAGAVGLVNEMLVKPTRKWATPVLGYSSPEEEKLARENPDQYTRKRRSEQLAEGLPDPIAGVLTPTKAARVGGPARFLRGSAVTKDIPHTSAFDSVVAALEREYGGLDKVPTVLNAAGERVPYALDAIAWHKIPDELLTPELLKYKAMGPHQPTLQEIVDHARWIDQHRLSPTVVEKEGHWRAPNKKEAPGREHAPEGRCTPDMPGCARHNFGEQAGLSGVPCLGEDCYAGQILQGKGGDVAKGITRGGLPAGKQRDALVNLWREEGVDAVKSAMPGWEVTELAPDFTLSAAPGKKLSQAEREKVRQKIEKVIEKQGRDRDWDKIQAKFPDVVIKPKYEGKPLSIARTTSEAIPEGAGARVPAEYPSATGRDVRLGVDNTADAYLSSPQVMENLSRSDPNSVFGIGAEYHGWRPGEVTPPANMSPDIENLAGRYVHNTTINGQLPLSENLARLLAAGERRKSGYNNVLRVIFADERNPWGNWNLTNPHMPEFSGSYDKRDVLNRLLKAVRNETDFYSMGQGYHNRKFASGPHETLPLPTCCAGGNCSLCGVGEGVARPYTKWWDMLTEHPEEKIMPTSPGFWQNVSPDKPMKGFEKYKPISPTPGVHWEEEVASPLLRVLRGE
jgi:hypothetical protein